ncbi:exopolysaccharide biosynthesis protein [Pseudooctadecabacter jejudonensis]|uniref:Exopolysaccharide synthesis, ExoD n=1 Tax=Pseudooctadecabacter jejudonensis TaxID=1391910 RepID=A0A1Y5T877_9RHOB|nr:exopolysaccharide biosynthesis protein [Pseudooctadecabacter jejudonensis]SLN58032.1 Exopolysaccharide synthesis, ExoD [Pseudooctadecabacter jejudonensis]
MPRPKASPPDQTHKAPVEAIVENLDELAKSGPVTVGDLAAEFGKKSFSTLILVVSLLLVSPLSGVPLFSSFCGLIICLLASQAAAGRAYVWMPRRIMAAHPPMGRFQAGIHRMRRFARWLDNRTITRLSVLVSPPFSRAVYAVCALAGALLPLMELVPLTSSMIGASVAMIATGLLARDGLLSLIGLIMLPIIFSIPVFAIAHLTAEG